MRVFGSAARGEDGGDSDVDLVIDYGSDVRLLGLISLQEELSGLLGRDVDLVTSDGPKPRVRESVERDAITL